MDFYFIYSWRLNHDIHDVPHVSNVINRNNLYKEKKDEDGIHILKKSIAPHSIEENLKKQTSKYFTVFTPSGLRILESISSLKFW